MELKDLTSPNQVFAILAKGVEGVKIIGINILLARVYGPELFGQFAYAISIVSIFAVLAEFRLQGILIKEFSNNNIPAGTLIGTGLVVNAFFASIGFVFLVLYSGFEQSVMIETGLVIFGLSFFYKIPRIFRSYFIALEKNHLIVKSELFSSFTSILVVAYVVFYELEITYALFGRSLDFLIFSLFLVFYFCKLKFGQIRPSFAIAKYLIIKSTPLVLSGVAMIVFQRIDLVLVKEIQGDYQAGLYASATNFMLLFSLLPMVLSESLAPKMFRKSESEEFDRTRKQYCRIIIGVGVVLSALMFVLSCVLVVPVYGEEYQAAQSVFLILSLSPLLISLGSVAGQIIIADGTQNWAYVKSILGCVVTIVLNFTLIPLIGIEGAAISTIAGLFVSNYASHFFIARYNTIFDIQNMVFRDFYSRFSQFILTGKFNV